MNKMGAPSWSFCVEPLCGVDVRDESLLTLYAKCSESTNATILRVRITATFDSALIPIGSFFGAHYRLGCVAAYVLCEATHCRLVDWAKSEFRKAKYTLSQEQGTESSLAPGAKITEDTLETSLASWKSTSKDTTQSEFSGPEFTIDALPKSMQLIKWAIRMNRAPKIARDYLTSAFDLFADFKAEHSPSTILCRAHAYDLRIFDQDDRALSGVASLAVRVKARLAGQPIARSGEVALVCTATSMQMGT